MCSSTFKFQRPYDKCLLISPCSVGYSVVRIDFFVSHNHQAVAPCLMNMVVLCQFWRNKLQLSPETLQTLQLCVWSLSQGKHWHKHSSFLLDWLGPFLLFLHLNEFKICLQWFWLTHGEISKSGRSCWKKSKIKDWMFIPQAVLKVLAEKFYSCVAMLPPSGWCKTSSDVNVLVTSNNT